jgi:hypothetical protein
MYIPGGTMGFCAMAGPETRFIMPIHGIIIAVNIFIYELMSIKKVLIIEINFGKKY